MLNDGLLFLHHVINPPIAPASIEDLPAYLLGNVGGVGLNPDFRCEVELNEEEWEEDDHERYGEMFRSALAAHVRVPAEHVTLSSDGEF